MPYQNLLPELRCQAKQSWKRGHFKHGIQCCQSEHASLRVAHNRPEGIIDACPSNATQNCDYRNPTQTDRFLTKAAESHGLVSCSPPIVGTFAFQHGSQYAVCIKDDEIRRRCYLYFKALRNLGLVVAASSNERYAILRKQRFNGLLNKVASLR